MTERSKNPHTKGTLSEAMFLAACVAKNIPVSTPYGINHRYDCIIDVDGVLRRVQVKTGRYRTRKQSIEFNAISSVWNYGSTVRSTGSRRYDGQAENFGVYVHDIGKVFLVPVARITTNTAILRYIPQKLGPKNGILLATDFEFYDFRDGCGGLDSNQ